MNETRASIIGAASPAGAPRILIVEGDSALSLLLAYNFEAEGFIVERVERGDDAELRIEGFVPDLVILDWNLPGLSGLEFCRRLRAQEANHALPVIMLTARGEEGGPVCGLSVADDYVVKPFFVQELILRVRALLRRAQPKQGAVKPPQSLLVSLADKTHNAEAILFDYQVLGDALWPRLTGGADGTRWYYKTLADFFDQAMPGSSSDRLCEPATRPALRRIYLITITLHGASSTRRSVVLPMIRL